MNETTLEQYVAREMVTVEIVRDKGTQVEDGWEHHAYVLNLLWADGRIVPDIAWKQGMGIEDSPTDRTTEVLDAVLRDSLSAEESFEDWCAEYGYDSDSRRAERLYNACLMMRGKIQRVLSPEQYDYVCSLEGA